VGGGNIKGGGEGQSGGEKRKGHRGIGEMRKWGLMVDGNWRRIVFIFHGSKEMFAELKSLERAKGWGWTALKNKMWRRHPLRNVALEYKLAGNKQGG